MEDEEGEEDETRACCRHFVVNYEKYKHAGAFGDRNSFDMLENSRKSNQITCLCFIYAYVITWFSMNVSNELAIFMVVGDPKFFKKFWDLKC